MCSHEVREDPKATINQNRIEGFSLCSTLSTAIGYVNLQTWLASAKHRAHVKRGVRSHYREQPVAMLRLAAQGRPPTVCAGGGRRPVLAGMGKRHMKHRHASIDSPMCPRSLVLLRAASLDSVLDSVQVHSSG